MSLLWRIVHACGENFTECQQVTAEVDASVWHYSSAILSGNRESLQSSVRFPSLSNKILEK